MPLQHPFSGSRPSTRRGLFGPEYNDLRSISRRRVIETHPERATVTQARREQQQLRSSPYISTMATASPVRSRAWSPEFQVWPMNPNRPLERPVSSGATSATLNDDPEQPPPEYSETMGMFLWSTKTELRKMPNPDEFIRRRRDDPAQEDLIPNQTNLGSPWSPIPSPLMPSLVVVDSWVSERDQADALSMTERSAVERPTQISRTDPRPGTSFDLPTTPDTAAPMISHQLEGSDTPNAPDYFNYRVGVPYRSFIPHLSRVRKGPELAPKYIDAPRETMLKPWKSIACILSARRTQTELVGDCMTIQISLAHLRF